MATLKTGWLLNKSGDKFAPKTLLSQVSTDDGILLEQKLEGDFQEINDSVTEIQEDIVNIEDNIDVIEHDLYITETTDTVLEDSYSGLLKVNEIGGITEQFSTTGAQLLDLSNPKYSDENATLEINNDVIKLTGGMIRYCFDTVRGQKYTISLESASKGVVVISHIYDFPLPEEANGNEEVNLGSVYPEVTDEEMTMFEEMFETLGYSFPIERNSVTIEARGDRTYISLNTVSGIQPDDVLIYKKLMINEGEVALHWEQYTDGLPVPRPDSTQEIKCVKGKNLLDCSELTEQTICGVTFTPVFDDSGNLQCIKLKGTHDGTGSCIYMLKSYNSEFDDNYIFNGVRNGSEGSYFVEISGRKSDGTAWWLKNVSGDTKFEPDTDYIYDIYICVIAGTTVNAEICPMLRKTSASDPTYVPYGLLRVKTHWKNFLENTMITQENSTGNVIFTPNVDGSITLNGTATQWLRQSINQKLQLLPGKEYVFTGCPSGGSYSTYYMYVEITTTTNDYIVYRDEGNGVTFTCPMNATHSFVAIAINENVTASNLVFYPMIREVGTDATYEPYTESSYTISKAIDLYGRDDVQDVITPNGIERKYYATKVTALDVFDDVVIAGCVYLPNNIATFTVADNAYHNAMSNMFSDIKPFNELYDDKSMQGLSIFTTTNAGGNQNLDFRITSIEQTLDAYNTFLATTPLEVVLERATPIFEPLPIVDQIGLNNLLTYNGVTYIEFDCDEVQPTFKGEYGRSKETGYILESLLNTRTNKLNQELINNRIVALEAIIVNNI